MSIKTILFLGAALLAAPVYAMTFNCYVVGISDGDTIKCLTPQKQEIKVRLSQIDAPESSQPFGAASKAFLGRLVFKQWVTINSASSDDYGRILGEIWLSKQNINKTMVANGYAWAYSRYVTDKNYFELQENARTKKLNLWGDVKPIYPSQYRSIQKLKD